MSGSFKIVVIAAIAALSLLPVALPQAANAQVDIRIGPQQAQQPPRGGAWGDRDHDGVPNRYDRFDNRLLRDHDHDGVPQAFDRNDHNPYRQ